MIDKSDTEKEKIQNSMEIPLWIKSKKGKISFRTF